MTQNERLIDAPPEAVWEILSDGWLYPLWVVGATRMREVDGDWPAVGSRLHHSAGVWPVIVNDVTEVRDCVPLQRLKLRAKGWPMGEADVDITLEAEGDGTRVTIEEDAAEGPARLTPGFVRAPLLMWRNTETLRRLANVAAGRVRR